MRRRREELKKAEKAASDAAKQEALDFFLLSIRDPHNPRHCGRCLYGAILGFTTSSDNPIDTPYQLPSSLLKNHDFWNSFFQFLFIKRTDKQLDRILTLFSQCSCRLTEKHISTYHETARQAEPGTMRRTSIMVDPPEDKKDKFTPERCAIAVKMFCVLFVCLSSTGVKSVAKGLVRTWPCAPSDLLPLGPDSLIQSLLQWYRFVPDPIIFSVAALILRVCRFIVIPSLIKYQFSNIFVESTRALVDCTVENLEKADSSLELQLRTMFSVGYHVRSFLDYFEVLRELPSDCKADVIRGCETKAMQLCSVLLYLCSDPRILPQESREDAMKFLPVYGQDLFRFFHMHMYPRPDMPLHPRVVAFDEMVFPPPPSLRSIPETAIFYIRDFHSEIRCSAYKCPNSIQSAGKDFQRCARCNTVAYCGRACQTTAWREEIYPHKRVCPILRRLIDVGGGPGMFYPASGPANKGTILKNWKEAGVPDDDLACVEAWGKLISSTKRMPDGTEWTPGYEDYNELVAKLTIPVGPGSKPRYMDRLKRWPSEVAKEKTLLELQAFWETDIDM